LERRRSHDTRARQKGGELLVKGIGLAVSVLATAVLLGSPALATKHHSTVSCKQIKDAIASGKSADEVAKDMKVSSSRVKSCTAPPAKHHKKGTAKAS
jgi:hypothetical protein